jgi:ketosteroid isomerase-like protein
MPRTTEQVLNHHLQAFGAGDLDGILEDYADNSFLVGPDGTVYEGVSQIRPVFEAFFTEFAKPGSSFAMGNTAIKNEVAFITWSAETADNVYEFGTDTFLVRDGKITAQTFGGKIRPKR